MPLDTVKTETGRMYNVIIGDIHLRDDAFNPRRLQILEDLLDQFRYNVSSTGGIWVLLGDINHAQMRLQDRNWLIDWLSEVQDVGPVLIVRGNHDRPGDLDMFEKLMDRVHVVEYPSTVFAARTLGGTKTRLLVNPKRPHDGFRIRVLPYIERKPSDGDTLTDLDALVGIWQSEEAEARAAGCMTVGHMNVAGAKVSSGQPQIGKEFELDATQVSILARQGPVFMGHIHKPQEVGQAVMVGSVCQQDWGEEGENKRVIVYETGIDERHRPWSSSPVYGPDMKTFELRANPDGVVPFDRPNPLPSHLRLRVAYNPHHTPPDYVGLRKAIPDTSTVKFVGVPDETVGVRCEKITEAKDVYWKMASYCGVNGIPWTEELRSDLSELVVAAAGL